MIIDLVSAAQQQEWERARRLLHQHWIAECPKLYAPNLDHPWEGPPDEKAIDASLFIPLAAALCADSNAKDSSLVSLNEQAGINPECSKAGQICGHVFKSGELTYTCKDCATDATCVMCHTCFQKSEHKHHKYKMHTSGGSGYCDCGDADAWKSGYACSDHAMDSDAIIVAAPSLPAALHTRLHKLLTVVLEYCNVLVCWVDENSLPDFLKPSTGDLDRELLSTVHPFITVLFNDETHTYESVIRALEMFIHCNKEEAMLIATIVDREGRSSVKVGSKQECERVKSEIRRRTSREVNRRTEKSGPLDVKVMESDLVAHQNHAISLMAWLNQQLELFPSLSDLVGNILLNADALPIRSGSSLDEDEETSKKESLLVRFLRWDKILWKAARSNLHQILMKTVLMNFEQKYQFARLFLQNYDEIYKDFIDDDHDLDVSIVSLSVQFLTVPGIARRLIAEEDAMQKIFKALSVHTDIYLRANNGHKMKCFDFANRSFPAILKRAMHMMRDQVYMLNTVPQPDQWTDPLRTNFINGFKELVQFLHGMQGMDEVKRQFMEHQVWELEWETAFNIQLRIQEILGLVIQWASTDQWVHRQAMIICLNALKMHPVDYEGESGSTHTFITVNDDEAVCGSFDVLRGYVSIHQQQWRLFAGLFTAGSELTHFLEKGVVAESEEEQLITRGIQELNLDLYENPLRVSVLCSQAAAQLWRRNGFSLINQIHNYYSPLCRTEMFDRDLLMLQIGAAVGNPIDFLLHVMCRFRLTQWAELSFDGSNRQNLPFGKLEPEETSKIVVALAEDMMHLFIQICGERYKPGLGKCTLSDHLRREVIHILCMGPHPFSQIVKKMPSDPQLEKISLHDIVNSVADFKKPASTSAGQFYLKDSLLSEYNPFFYHYSKSDLSQAELYQQKLRAKSNRDIISCPPPVPCEFEPFFAPITGLLKCGTMIRLCRAVLERTAKRNRFSSERLLHRALYLIGMALREQERDANFEYVKVAKEENILTFLQNLASSNEVSTHAELLAWTIRKFVEVSNKSRDAGSDASHATEYVQQAESTADSKAKRAQIAAKMRAQAMQKMQKMQSSFIVKMDKEATPAESGSAVSVVEDKTPIGVDEDEDYVKMVPSDDFPVCLGPHRSTVESVVARKVTCMLCQEEETLTPGQGRPFVCAAYVQKSLLFAQKDVDQPSVRYFRGDFVPAGLHIGTDASTCSHTMHYECYQSLSDTLLSRERQRPRQQMMFNQKMVDPESGEYLCPLCKRLSNTAMPVLPPLPLMGIDGFSSTHSQLEEDFDTWVWRVKDMLEAPTRTAPSRKPKSHSRKRSHSERSLIDLAKQEDELSTMPLENNLSTSVPSASTMTLLLGGISDIRHSPAARTTSHVNTKDASSASESCSSEVSAENRQLIIELEALIAADAAERTTDSASSSRTEDVRRERRGDKNFSFPQSITGLLRGMPGIASILKIHRMISPVYDRYEDMIRGFSKFLAQNREKRSSDDKNKELFEENMRGYLCALAVWQSTTHVLRATAAVLQNENKPLFGALNTRQRDCLVFMSRLCAVLSFSMQHIPEHAALTLRALLSPPPLSSPPFPTSPKSPLTVSSPTHVYSPNNADGQRSGSSSTPETMTSSTPLKLLSSPIVQFLFSTHSKLASQGAAVNILHIDMLSLAVSLSMSIGWTWQDGVQSMRHPKKERELLPDGSVDEHYCVKLCLLGHYFQVVASFIDSEVEEMETDDDHLGDRVRELWMAARPHDEPLKHTKGLIQRLHSATLLFLRPIALLYHSISMISPPEALRDPFVSEFEPLCRYLGLSTNLHDLLSGTTIERLFEMWSTAIPADVHSRSRLVSQPVQPNTLITLPDEFSDLIQLAARFRCPTVPFEETATNIPTLCLVCGTILCSQSYCCQKTVGKETVGACRYHMTACSGAMGAFLRIRDCSVVLMTTRQRGCFRPAPYVDEFGEADQGFRRGNPLHLNKELYKKLRQLWLSQGITEEVVNQYEIDHRNMQYDWAHF